MNTENTNQPRQAANAAFEQWWQRHGLEDPMDDEDRYYITASSWARRGYLAAMLAQQAEPVARDVPAAFGSDVKKECCKAWGAADECDEGNAIRDCDITAIVDRYAAQPPAVAAAVPDGWRDVIKQAAEKLQDLCAYHLSDELRRILRENKKQTGDAIAWSKAVKDLLLDWHDGTVVQVYRGKPAAIDIATNRIAAARAMLAAAPQAAVDCTSKTVESEPQAGLYRNDEAQDEPGPIIRQFGYQPLFNAISSATKWRDGRTIEISVLDFQKALLDAAQKGGA